MRLTWKKILILNRAYNDNKSVVMSYSSILKLKYISIRNYITSGNLSV